MAAALVTVAAFDGCAAARAGSADEVAQAAREWPAGLAAIAGAAAAAQSPTAAGAAIAAARSAAPEGSAATAAAATAAAATEMDCRRTRGPRRSALQTNSVVTSGRCTENQLQT